MQPHAKLVHNNIPSFENPTLSAFPPDSHRDRSYDTSLSHSSSLKSNSGKLLAIKIEQETGQRTTRWKHLARGEFKASVGKSVLVIGGKRHSEDSYITVTGEMKKCKVTPNASYNQPVMTLHSLLVTERMAVLCGISLAEDAGLGPAIIETDSKVLIRLVNSDITLLSEAGLFIYEIIQAFYSGKFVSISFVPRLANMAVYSIAQVAFSLDFFSVWMEDVPPAVASVLQSNGLAW
ncbi:hypothetical protein ACOSQ2_007133 [Xanthoceras sorbifolium]